MRSVKVRESTRKDLGDAHLVAVGDLCLDPKNPRLVGGDYSISDQVEIVRKLWEEFNVGEIVDSILASNSFWKHEPLIAAREDGKLIVVEGNRRLAAVKILLDPKKYRVSSIGPITRELRENLAALPVIEQPREAIWDFIGFKHVNGPQEWGSIAKAQYIARVHEDYDIAKAIGDGHSTVQRLYHGLKVLEQAEKAGVFDRADRYHQRKDFAYSHLWTGLGYEGIRKFLGIKEGAKDKRHPVPKPKIPALGDLCLWLYGSSKAETEPLIKSQNPDLRILNEVLLSDRGISALKRQSSLQSALNAARGDESLLLDALVAGEQNLRDAKAYFSTGYRGQDQVVLTVKNIKLLADSLGDELKAKKAK